MKRVLLVAAVVALLLVPAAQGKVVNEFTEPHPKCDGISQEVSFTVRGGRDQAEEFPGAVFTFDEREFEIPPCARVHVTFINEDDIRHQFMVHGTFPNGFFLIEVDGPGRDNGTFTAGPDPKTRLVHCGLPQHQQKGMKAQLLLAGGEGDLPNILGISGIPEQDRARSAGAVGPALAELAGIVPFEAIVIAAAALAGVLGGAWIERRRERS